ncbi:hypothetical protein EJ06DRAFT_329453 [Trichodelitschia bisporula]|uniref:Uncharacterized protein n=1 Tax=Trichodelitschia bisporula TaxID=703511 RepID=A0A6G1I1N5_9PEZI|nr:hypothetical protein EJ06DRAFT_329453 [Trichodelitschia bisporula]
MTLGERIGAFASFALSSGGGHVLGGGAMSIWRGNVETVMPDGLDGYETGERTVKSQRCLGLVFNFLHLPSFAVHSGHACLCRSFQGIAQTMPTAKQSRCCFTASTQGRMKSKDARNLCCAPILTHAQPSNT